MPIQQYQQGSNSTIEGNIESSTSISTLNSFKSVIFDTSKREAYHPNSSYKRLQRRLKNNGYKIWINKDELTAERLHSNGHILVFGAPREKFSTVEFSEIKSYLEAGNSVLFTVTEGGKCILYIVYCILY